MYLEIFLADFAVIRVFFGNFAGFRGKARISRVRDRAKYQKPCFVADDTELFFSVGRMCSTLIFYHWTNQILNL